MITVANRPVKDKVIYDGQCRFCRSQIAVLRRLDLGGRFDFVSLHDPSVLRDLPEISPEEMLSQMYVVDRQGRARGGAEAVRYLSRKLPLLWPLALLLHLPGTMPIWNAAYRFVARNRMRIAGSCEEGTCRIPR
jgi:hypothetical protein